MADSTAHGSRWKGGTTAYLLAALLLVGIGAIGALLLARVGNPQVLASAAAPSDLTVASQPWDDPRPAGLTLALGPAEHVVAPTAGLLTQTSCAPGTPMKSGTVAFSIDGRPLLTLATGTPLWRDLAVGASGSDAAALITALRAAGQQVEGSTVTSAVITAYDAVAKAAGVPASGGTISRAGVVWIPRAEVSVVSCDAPVGAAVEPGRPLASLTQTLVSARLTAVPNDLVTGPRVFAVGGQSLALGSAGVGADGLAWLTAHPESIQAGQTPTVTGMLKLATALDVLPIPPAALGPVSAAGKSCVTTPDGPRGVTVVGSQLGTAYVTPDGGATIRAVVLDRSRMQACG